MIFSVFNTVFSAKDEKIETNLEEDSVEIYPSLPSVTSLRVESVI